MRQMNKGGPYYFFAKVHRGVDDEAVWMHSLAVIVSNVADATQVDKLLRDSESIDCTKAGCISIETREE
jgi:IS5 family transposase